ncbi:hypothetical protein [Parvibaculum sp. MBR-TMA-1.3b-4.2]
MLKISSPLREGSCAFFSAASGRAILPAWRRRLGPVFRFFRRAWAPFLPHQPPDLAIADQKRFGLFFLSVRQIDEKQHAGYQHGT